MFYTAMLSHHIVIEIPIRAESWYPTVWLCVRTAKGGSQENRLTQMAVALSYRQDLRAALGHWDTLDVSPALSTVDLSRFVNCALGRCS